jgi:hypothetical protein
MFAIGKSTIHLVLQEFVFFKNKDFGAKIKWLKGKDLVQVMATFKIFCGLLVIHNAIDVTQIHIQKSGGTYEADYFS